jgi:hypothetical protein
MEWERLVQAQKEVKLDNGQVIYILLTSAAEGVIVKYIIIRPFEVSLCCGRAYPSIMIVHVFHYRLASSLTPMA